MTEITKNVDWLKEKREELLNEYNTSNKENINRMNSLKQEIKDVEFTLKENQIKNEEVNTQLKNEFNNFKNEHVTELENNTNIISKQQKIFDDLKVNYEKTTTYVKSKIGKFKKKLRENSDYEDFVSTKVTNFEKICTDLNHKYNKLNEEFEVKINRKDITKLKVILN